MGKQVDWKATADENRKKFESAQALVGAVAGTREELADEIRDALANGASIHICFSGAGPENLDDYLSWCSIETLHGLVRDLRVLALLKKWDEAG